MDKRSRANDETGRQVRARQPGRHRTVNDSSEKLESRWEKVYSITISTEGVAAVEPMTRIGPSVELKSGTYDICLQMLTKNKKVKVSRVRIVRTSGGSAAPVIDDVSTDFPIIGILDASAVNSGPTGLDYQIQVVEGWQRNDPWGIVRWGENSEREMVYVKTGFEDGSFDVKEVLKAGRAHWRRNRLHPPGQANADQRFEHRL